MFLKSFLFFAVLLLELAGLLTGQDAVFLGFEIRRHLEWRSIRNRNPFPSVSVKCITAFLLKPFALAADNVRNK
jgi:hypothetical protein